MTRKSERELERAVDRLSTGADTSALDPAAAYAELVAIASGSSTLPDASRASLVDEWGWLVGDSREGQR